MPSFSKWLSAQRKNILLSFISILVTLLVGEACLQIYYRWSMKSWLWNYNAFHVTFVAPVNDRRQYALRPGFADTQIGVTVNQKGLRAPAAMAEPDRQTPVVVSLGDSKAFGSGVRDEETYSFQLDQTLKSKGSALRAVNAGVASYNMRQALDRFRLDVLPNYTPAVVTLQATFNDISLLTYYREQWNPERTWADVRYAGFTPPLPVLQKLATVYYLNRAAASRTQKGGDSRSQDVMYQPFADEAMLANLRGEMESFIASCKEKSIPVVLLPIDPFYYQTANMEKNQTLPLWAQDQKYVELWRDMIAHYDGLLVELSDKHDLVYFFDTRKLMDATDRGKMYVDAFHYSPEGNRLVAEGLYELLSKENLLAPKSGAGK